MRYWWVNQNQTYQHEVPGGYLWSPKLKSNGHLNPFYEFMREVSPGDVIFSFCNTLVRAIGIAQTNAYEAPKPKEFGSVGAYWELIGWRIDIRFFELKNVIRPADHMVRLRPYLRASHTKPWRDASNQERLDGENGLLLTPDADLLFDRGFISFENNGDVLVSPVANLPAVAQMGIGLDQRRNVGAFSEGQRRYLEFHRSSVFLQARVSGR